MKIKLIFLARPHIHNQYTSPNTHIHIKYTHYAISTPSPTLTTRNSDKTYIFTVLGRPLLQKADGRDSVLDLTSLVLDAL